MPQPCKHSVRSSSVTQPASQPRLQLLSQLIWLKWTLTKIQDSACDPGLWIIMEPFRELCGGKYYLLWPSLLLPWAFLPWQPGPSTEPSMMGTLWRGTTLRVNPWVFSTTTGTPSTANRHSGKHTSRWVGFTDQIQTEDWHFCFQEDLQGNGTVYKTNTLADLN